MTRGHHDPATRLVRIGWEDTDQAGPTPAMTRRLAMHEADLRTGWGGREPSSASGWHNDGEHETTLPVGFEQMRMDLSPGGAKQCRLGDFSSVPARAVHRGSNPGEKRSHAVPVAEPTTDAKEPARR